MFSETKQNKRIRVLKDEEYQQTYGLPMFSREEQEWFFELTQQELSVLDTAATTETKIDAILQLGYFKAKQSFFAWTFNSVQSDFDYIRHRYFDSVITTKSTIGRKAKYNNQQWVLSLFGYALFSKEKHSERLSEKINNPARTYYASLAEHYTAQGLNRTKQLQSCFWLLCFIHYRYQRMCDNLVTMFIYIFNQYDKAIKESTQALLLAEALSEAAQKAVVAKLMRFYIDKDIDRTQPFSSIIEKAYSIIDLELIEQVATRYENHKFNEKFTWQSISELLPNWLNEKEAVLKKLSTPRLDQSVDQFIEEKAKPLDKKIIAINEAIQNGQNPDVKIKTAKNGSIIWTLPYTKKDIELNNPFYEKIPTVSISQVLHFVNQHTRFIQQFTHIKPHKAKSQLDELCIFANLIGKGTNLGSAKMAELCDLPQNELTASDQHFIRLATLRNDNDVISNAIAALPIFRHWNFAADLLHASLDGQKFITEFDTLLSRYSPKYFGLMKGVVAYTLLANHITLNVKIIGANEHESCHLFDLIYNNTSNVQPDIFSTDTEGSNQLNFLLLNLINKVFAPRYRSLSTKTESIISFSDPKKFEDLLIKPSSQLHVNRLLKQENNIQHILASLLIGETNQSNIISKLSCNAFSNQTKLPLWDMNAVLMSDYLLDYISDVVVRQSVQGALNRGEAYHQLRRHISSIHGKNFRGTNDREISIWNECARLLANATIYFNASILTKLMDYNERQGDVAQANLIKKFSPVAWTHINFYGRYDLLRNDASIDLDKIIRQLSTKAIEVDYLHLLNKNNEIQVYAEI
jgi:TnpA family transposase